MLVILALAFLWYILVPIGGAFWVRHGWRVFRRRFNELRKGPLLDYALYNQIQKPSGGYRFLGGVESVTDEHTLWLRNQDMSIPAALTGADVYILPLAESEDILLPFDPGRELPEKIRWNRMSAISEGAKVFVGGNLELIDERLTFVSSKENPLLIIFYDGADDSLGIRVIRAGRHKNEYWNKITPYALLAGAFSELLIALSFTQRPAYQLTALTAFVVMLSPLLAYIPPGLAFTVLSGRLWKLARIYRASRDLARLPLVYMADGENRAKLPDGEDYGSTAYDKLPDWVPEKKIPVLPPGFDPPKGEGYYIFGVQEAARESGAPPERPRDPLAGFWAIAGNPARLAKRCAAKAYRLEAFSFLLAALGAGINLGFIALIVMRFF